MPYLRKEQVPVYDEMFILRYTVLSNWILVQGIPSVNWLLI